jgi:ABC-2 type transport system permease protein
MISVNDATTSPPNEHRSTPRETFLSDTWTNLERYMQKFLRNPMLLSATLFQPIVWLVLFTEVLEPITAIPGFEAESYLEFFLPSIVIMIALIAGATSGIGLVDDLENGMFEKMLASPMNRSAIFLGKTLADAVQILIQVVIVLGLGLLLGARIETGLLGALGVLAVALVFSLWFIALSTIVALRTQSSEATMAIGNVLALPLIFVSTAVLPASILPGWVQTISVLNPVSYGVEAARTIILDGWVWETILPALGVLIMLDVVVGAVAIVTLNRAMSANP